MPLRLKFYIFGALLTALGLVSFTVSDQINKWYLRVSNQPFKPASTKFENYLKIRKLFVFFSGVAMAMLSMFIPE